MTPGLSKEDTESCVTMPFSMHANPKIRHIRPYVTWAIGLLIADGQLIFLGSLWGMYGLTYSLYHPQEESLSSYST